MLGKPFFPIVQCDKAAVFDHCVVNALEPLPAVGAKGDLLADAQIKIPHREDCTFELVALRVAAEAAENFRPSIWR